MATDPDDHAQSEGSGEQSFIKEVPEVDFEKLAKEAEGDDHDSPYPCLSWL